MLIICSGPDTWQARKKARELVEAFRAKHDASGFSTETLNSDDFSSVLNQIGSPSIFSPKRMIRCDGLLEGIKANQLKLLAGRLKSDEDKTIVLTVETEVKESALKELKGVAVYHYSYSLLSGMAFDKWCVQRAHDLGVSDEKAHEISQRCQADVWQAEQELNKLAANPGAPLAELEMDPGSVFDAADKYFSADAGWRSVFYSLRDEQLTSILLSQARSAIRVRDNETGKLPYFVVRKMQKYNPAKIIIGFFNSLRAFIASRSGLAGSNEIEPII